MLAPADVVLAPEVVLAPAEVVLAPAEVVLAPGLPARKTRYSWKLRGPNSGRRFV